jgi:hypothetical protein
VQYSQSQLKFSRNNMPLFRAEEWAKPLLPACFILVSCLAYLPALKTEATYSSEMSPDFHQTTQHYIPDDKTPHNHWQEDLKCYTAFKLIV